MSAGVRLVQADDGAQEWIVYNGDPRDDMTNWLGDVHDTGLTWFATPAQCPCQSDCDDCHESDCARAFSTRDDAVAYLVARATAAQEE